MPTRLDFGGYNGAWFRAGFPGKVSIDMKILTASEMQRVDRLTTERYGVPSLTLMENAGNGVVSFLRERLGPLDRQRILVLCGRGNNGGDGMVAARLLHELGFHPRVVLLADPSGLRGDAAVNYGRLAALSPPDVITDAEGWERMKPVLREATLVIDAVLGTGLSKPLHGFLLEVVRDVNSLTTVRRVAVDLPSGLAADSGDLIGEAVHADASVTFTAPKHAHVFPPACELCGELCVHPIGTPGELLDDDASLFLRLISGSELSWLVAPRRMDSHKGTYGHVLILAGSLGKTGAAALAAGAAYRSGAGLVTVATPKSALPVIASLGMEWMTAPLPETSHGTVSLQALSDVHLGELMQGKSVLAVGPGVGTVPETAELVRRVVSQSSLPVVLDADGLNAFAGHMDEMKAEGRLRVLTPHPGEMARLCGSTVADILKRRVEAARDFARRYQVHLVLKGARTLVASPDGEVAVNPTGNPGMATGGTGDCLTGIIAGLLAQFPRRPPAGVVSAAVYLHGLAGDFAARKMGQASMMAGDLLRALPEALQSLGSRPE